MSTNEYRLSVRRGPEEGQTFTLTSGSVTVGRDPMAEIVLSDPEVSRQHARFTRTEGGFQLQDLGSTNGTFVDGKRLSGEAVELQPGAVITMGSNVTLVYEATVDPMATVISPEGFEFDESDEGGEADDALRTMIEEPDMFAEESEAAGAAMDVGEEATPVEFPPAPEPEALPSFDLDEDEDDDFSFDFEETDYGEPVAQSGATPDDRTVLDMEAGDISSFATPSSEDDSLPSFGESSDLPSFDDVDDVYEQPPPVAPAGGKMPPPPPPPSTEPDPNRRRSMIIAIVVVLLLCCCLALVVGYLGWTYGDQIFGL